MGKRNKRKQKQNGGGTKGQNGANAKQNNPDVDPWKDLLTAKSAHATLFKKSAGTKADQGPTKPRKSDNKKKRSNDGSEAILIPANMPIGAKRAKLPNGSADKQTSKVTSVQNGDAEKDKENVSDTGSVETHLRKELHTRLETSEQKKGRKRKVAYTAESIEGVDYFVEEPEDDTNKAAKEQHSDASEDVTDEELEDESDEDEELSDDDDDDEDIGADFVLRNVIVNGHNEDEDGEGEGGESDEDEMEDEEDEDDVMEIADSDEAESMSEESEDESEDDSEGEEIDEEEDLAFVAPETVELVSAKKGEKIDFNNFPFSGQDSQLSAQRAFAWLIAPCDSQDFFEKIHQKLSLVSKRNEEYYGNLFSTEQFTKILQENHVEYGKNINIAEYSDGVRKTLNGEGRAYPHHLVHHLSQGRSVQLVNPQAFSSSIWYLCEILQETLQCFVGANTYLTPANSSGFAPHWDDIDAFLLQVEGRKYWKVYAPEGWKDSLPREPSGNFSDEDMRGREPAFEGWLEQGDVLYIPRGFIHQAKTEELHSLHVTVSFGRHWSWADMLEKVLPEALEAEAEQRRKMRMDLPIGLFDITGVADMPYTSQTREEVCRQVLGSHARAVARRVESSLESAIDLMAREFLKTALPPLLTPEERSLSVLGGPSLNILSSALPKITNTAEVRLIRRHGQRLFFESEDEAFMVHRYANSRVYEERPECSFEFPVEFGEHWARLYEAYPEWMQVSELPKKGRKEFVQLLFHNGCLMIRSE